jgi:hypothetical protein
VPWSINCCGTDVFVPIPALALLRMGCTGLRIRAYPRLTRQIEPHCATVESQKGTRRPWWRKLIGR